MRMRSVPAASVVGETSPSPQTIHHGLVFNAAVESAPFTQSNNNIHGVPSVPSAPEVSCSTSDTHATTPSDPPAAELEEESKTHAQPLAPPFESEYEPDVIEPPKASRDTSAAKAALTKTYSAMHNHLKWALASGRTVEAVVCEACLDMDDEAFAVSLAPSFVLDMSDPTHEGWFTPGEWAEIRACVPPLPKLDPVFVESLRRFFSVKTTADLRTVLRTTSYLPTPDTVYDRNIHFDSEWADLVIRLVLALFEAPGEPLRAAHLEDWYTSYLWSPIFDQCLLSLPGMTIERYNPPLPPPT